MTNNDVQKIISETAEATAKAIYNKIQLEAKKLKQKLLVKNFIIQGCFCRIIVCLSSM